MLRGHVRHGAQTTGVDGQLCLLDQSGDAEIRENPAALRIDENVGRLDVAVDRPGVVDRLQTVREFCGPRSSRPRVEGARFIDQLIQGPPLDEVEHDVGLALMHAGVQDPVDIRVLHDRADPGFVFEAAHLDLTGLLRTKAFQMHALDGDPLASLRVSPAVHGAGRAVSQDLVAYVGPEG